MTIRQLSAGIDSLYWSAPCGIDTRRFDALKKARDAAAQTGISQPWRAVKGFALSIGSHGAGRYPVFLDCHEFRLQLTDSHHLRPSTCSCARRSFTKSASRRHI